MAVQKPNIEWRGSPNYWGGRDGNVPLAVINHVMQGSMESSDGWFKNRASQVSAHFGVAKDGRIWQWVNTADSAWANGIEEREDTSVPWIAWADANGINLNRVTISIEHEGNTGEPMPEAQYQATLSLQRWLLDAFGIPADREHINGHYQIAALSRPNCPGSAFPWARLIADLNNTEGVVHVPDTLTPQPQAEDPNARFFKETNIWLVNSLPDGTRTGFYDYWKANGGINSFGLPTTPAAYDPETNRISMWFEAACLEYWPENADPYKVLRRLLGNQYKEVKAENFTLKTQMEQLKFELTTLKSAPLAAADPQAKV